MDDLGSSENVFDDAVDDESPGNNGQLAAGTATDSSSRAHDVETANISDSLWQDHTDDNVLIASMIAGFDIAPSNAPTTQDVNNLQHSAQTMLNDAAYDHNSLLSPASGSMHSPAFSTASDDNISQHPPMLNAGAGFDHNYLLPSTASGTMNSFQHDSMLGHRHSETDLSELNHFTSSNELHALSETLDQSRHSVASSSSVHQLSQSHHSAISAPSLHHTTSSSSYQPSQSQLSVASTSNSYQPSQSQLSLTTQEPMWLPPDTQELTEVMSPAQSVKEATSSNSTDHAATALGSDSRHHSQDELDCKPPSRASSLCVPTDESFLDPVHIFLRRDCIEVFQMTDEDLTALVKGSVKKVGRVGLRCRYCKHLPKNELAGQASCFPSKRSTIYESIRNFRRFHLNECSCIPKQVKTEFKRMEQQLSLADSTISHRFIKAYYSEAASELGLVDTPDGLMFGAPPNTSGTPSPMLQSLIEAAQNPTSASKFWKAYSSITDKKKPSEKLKFYDVASEDTKRVILEARREPTFLVKPEDFPTVSDHHFVLYHQFIPCSPPESLQDNEQKAGIGVGVCCKHCSTHTQAGVSEKKNCFFPPDFKTFGDSFYVKRLFTHVMTCDFVPKDIKDSLEELQRLVSELGATAKRGTRQRFLKKVWERLEEYSCLKNP